MAPSCRRIRDYTKRVWGAEETIERSLDKYTTPRVRPFVVRSTSSATRMPMPSSAGAIPGGADRRHNSRSSPFRNEYSLPSACHNSNEAYLVLVIAGLGVARAGRVADQRDCAAANEGDREMWCPRAPIWSAAQVAGRSAAREEEPDRRRSR